VQVVQRARDAQHHAVAERVPAQAPVGGAVLGQVARQRGIQVAAGHVLSAHGKCLSFQDVSGCVEHAMGRCTQHKEVGAARGPQGRHFHARAMLIPLP
jgi:hypothetical protein